MFNNQQTALMIAAQIVEELPAGTVFGIEVTDDDTHEEPSVFNIYAGSHDGKEQLKKLLRLDTPTDEGEYYTSYRVGPLLVSIMEPEEEPNE